MLLLRRRLLGVLDLLARLAAVQPLQREEYEQRYKDEEHLVPAALMGEHDGGGGHRNRGYRGLGPPRPTTGGR